MLSRQIVPRSFLLLSFFAATSCSHLRQAPVAAPAAASLDGGFRSLPPGAKAFVRSKLIPASDRHFTYAGRIDHSDPTHPSFIWQASRASIEFRGDSLALHFAEATGQNFFDAEVDGTNYLLAVPAGAAGSAVFQAPLKDTRHQFVLFKRSEATAGTVRFAGIEIAAPAKVSTSKASASRLRMEFFGDSITVGACNEDGETDQWESRRTHNAARSYPAFTAAAFAADYRNIAVSGMGIVTGWTDRRAIQIWDRLYPEISSPPANLESWLPEVAFVNLGENDDSYSNAKKQPFPATFTDEYVRLVQAIRKAYPKTQIVLLRGGMWGGSGSPVLREAWESAVSQIESKDPQVTHFVFTHWSKNHPRVADDQAMADELVAWLAQQSFMKPYVSAH
jgi:lysophospholipase L1-like esterase